MERIPQRSIVFGVNDTTSRIGWGLLAALCVYGAVNAVKGMEIGLDEDHVGYKYLGMASVTFYLIYVLKSIFSESPSPVFRAGRWVRYFIPLILFLIIYFTIFNFQTFQVSLLVLSIVFGVVVFSQLVCPVEGFHFAYVLIIMMLACLLALFAQGYDPKIHSYFFCFLTLSIFQFPLYCFNFHSDKFGLFSF